MKTVKSQLVNTPAGVATIAPQSQLARYVQADIKGGAFKLDFLKSLIANAVTEAFKNNGRAIAEAGKLADGKAKKVRAYAAGFAAVGDIAPVPYKGKYDSKENAPIRAQIDVDSQAAVSRFVAAFEVVMAEKAEPKAKKAAPAPAPAADAPAAAPAVMVADGVVSESLDVDVVIATACNAIVTGLASMDDIEAIRDALAQHDLLASIAAQSAAQQASAAAH